MKHLNYLLVVVAAILITLGINSCAKEEIIQSSLSSTESRTAAIPIGTTIPTFRTTPTVVSGILKFNSKQHLREFWEDLENSDDDQLNLMEQNLSFVSLRSEYNAVENKGNTRDGSFPFVINNPFDALVFNQYHELWVGNYIYKLVDKRLVVRTTSAYVSEIISMRNNDGMVREHTELIDRNTKETLPEPPVTNRTKCTMSITVPFNPTSTNGGNSVYAYIKPIVINTDGNKVNVCAGNFSINWGDGFSYNSSGDINAPKSHEYNVGPGECKIFKVKVTIDLTLCGECTGTIVTEQSINVCSPITCTTHEHETGEKLVLDQVYGGTQNNDFRAFFIMGYDSDDYLWHDARAWGHIKFFEKTTFGGGVVLYSPITRKVNSRIFIHGAVFKEKCIGTRITVSANSNIQNKKREHRFMWKLDDVNFRLRSDDDLFCDFEVFNTNNFSSPDISLYNRIYSNL